MDHSQETTGRFVVARGQTAKLFETTEKALDFIAVTIQIAVNRALTKAILFARNHGFGSYGGHAG